MTMSNETHSYYIIYWIRTKLFKLSSGIKHFGVHKKGDGPTFWRRQNTCFKYLKNKDYTLFSVNSKPSERMCQF